MKKQTKKVDWGEEISSAVKLTGKGLLKALGWIVSIIMTIGLIGVITGVIVGGVFLLYVNNHLDTGVEDFSIMAKERNLTTTISYVDDNGNIVEIESERLSASEKRMWVSYEEMGDYIPKAFVAIEDKRFESHEGVDWIRTIKVTFDYFLGGGSQGGSTITQQLIKNITGNDDVTIQRKAQEIFQALNLEKKYDKTEILEMYLNNIYLSQSCYGVGAASWAYFSKEPSDLTLIEAAAIAAVTQNPSKWDPIVHPQNNADRRNRVIQQMYDQGRITHEEYLEAYGQDLVLNPPETDSDIGVTIHSWYTDAAQQEAVQLLMQEFGYTKTYAEKMLLTSGFNIVTAQNPKIQSIVEKYYEDDSYWERHDESPIQPKSSCVIIDPNNGNVIALVGDRGQKTLNLGLNYATQTKRPPGSTIKPVGVYGPGLELGVFTYGTVFDDIPINFGKEEVDPETGNISYGRPGGYPKNSPNRYDGLLPVHSAIKVSKNTIAWKAVEAVGFENSYDFITNKLGVSTLVKRAVSSNGSILSDLAPVPLAMGELTYGATVKEMTAAYQVFANGGIFNQERIVLQILDSDGRVVVDNQLQSNIVMSAENAAIMTKMLQEVVGSGGTASSITLKSKVNCAGKTGTTSSNKDRWFIGYTPYYVCGIWFGYSMPRSLDNFSAVPVKMWDKIMTEIMTPIINASKSGGPKLKTFEMPKSVITATYCKDSGKLISDTCKADPRGSRAEIGYFVRGTEPTEYCTTHVLVDYDKAHSSVATPYCDAKNIIQVALLNVKREFLKQIKVTDSQYTMQPLPDDYVYRYTDESYYLCYYFDLLPKGIYSGYTGNTMYNRMCAYHVLNPAITPDDSNSDNDTANEVASIIEQFN